MNDYLNLIPKELNIIITSYSSYNDIIELNQLVELDYIQLLLIKFFELYHKNIKDYDIKNIYLDLLKLSEKFDYFIIDEISLNPDILLELSPETFEYLSLNDEIYPREDIIAQHDNLKVFKYFEDDIFDISTYIINNSTKILEYILNDPGLMETWPDIKEDVMSAFYKSDVNLVMTKLLFKYFTFDNSNLFSILSGYYSVNLSSFEYILDQINIKTKDDIGWLLRALNDLYNEDLQLASIKFKMIYQKFKNNLYEYKDEVIDIYKGFIFNSYNQYNTDIELNEKIMIITILSNDDIIKSYFNI